MADLIAPLGEIASAILPVVIVARRGWYGLCCIAGYAQASQSGLTPSSAEAFASGRQVVIQTVSTFWAGRIKEIDWRGFAIGADHAATKWRLHASIAWEGMQHDFRKLLYLALPERQIAAERRARIEASKDPIEAQYLSGLMSVHETPQAERTLDQRFMEAQITHDLVTMGRAPDSHLQPLLSVAANPFLMQARLYALGAAGVAILGGVGWAFHEHHEAQKARQWSADNKALREDITDRDARLKALRVQITAAHVECVTDQLQSAEMRAKQDQRARTASLSARARIKHATDQTAPAAFDIDAALAGLRKPAGDTPAASAAGGPGADRVAVSLPAAPAADAPTP